LKAIRAADREKGWGEYETSFDIGFKDGLNNTYEHEPQGHWTSDAELEGYYHGLQAGEEERARRQPHTPSDVYGKEGKDLERLKAGALGTSTEWRRYAQGRAAGQTALEQQLKAGAQYWDIYRYLHGNLEGVKKIQDSDHRVRKERRAFLVGEAEVMLDYLNRHEQIESEQGAQEQRNRTAHSKMVEERWKKERTFKCPYLGCGQGFPSQTNLNYHMRSDHNYPAPY